jgi:hypothetical protein
MSAPAVYADARELDDRCDRCNAAAQTVYANGRKTLSFCGHHSRQYGANLLKDGWRVPESTV